MTVIEKTEARHRFEKTVPTLVRNAISATDAAYFYGKFSEIFDVYRQKESSSSSINVVHFHHLSKDPEYKDVVFDFISEVTKSDAFDFCTKLIGDRISYLLSISQLRVQYPKIIKTHVPLHQDLAFTGTDFPVLNCWIPLVDCSENAPGLEFIDRLVTEDLTDMVQREKSDYELFNAIDLTSQETFLRDRYGGTLIAPVMKAGDALVFDQWALHRTYVTPTMTVPRFSIELRGFSADHAFRDPDRWLRDRANSEAVIATKGREAVYLTRQSLERIALPQRERFQFVPERKGGDTAWEQAKQRMDSLISAAEQTWGSTRNRSLLPNFMNTAPYSGRCFITPLGADTRSILPCLERTPGLELAGIIDRRAGTLGSYQGHRVLLPEALAEERYDHVLVPHIVPEQVEELITQLRQAGIPRERIIDVYADTRFAETADRCKQDEVTQLLRGAARVDHVVLCESRTYIMGREAIRSLLPPENTVIVMFGALEPGIANDGYRCIAANSGIAAVRTILRCLQPRTILVRSSVGTQFLGYVAKQALPNAKLVHELYDLWLSLAEMPVARLAAVFGLSEDRFELNRLGEEFSLRSADLIVSKRFGDGWSEVLPEGGATYASYYPLIEPELIIASKPTSALAAVTHNRPLAIVDATSLMPVEAIRQNPDVLISYAPFEIMEVLAGLERVTFDVFNGFHRTEQHDTRYRDYLTRYAQGAIRYHRGMPEIQLVEALSEFDYGWINVAVPMTHPDAPYVALNRFTCYIAAGLPVIVSARLKHAAALVEQFDAGIVVPEYTVGATRKALRQADPGRHRLGALALRTFLLAENQRTLERIRNIL